MTHKPHALTLTIDRLSPTTYRWVGFHPDMTWGDEPVFFAGDSPTAEAACRDALYDSAFHIDAWDGVSCSMLPLADNPGGTVTGPIPYKAELH